MKKFVQKVRNFTKRAYNHEEQRFSVLHRGEHEKYMANIGGFSNFR